MTPERRAARRGYDRKRSSNPGRQMYKTRAWKVGRLLHLGEHPLCAMCLKDGRTTAANVVDHIVPHRGDRHLFMDRSNWQSLCEHHHDVVKQREEARGYADALDVDGWPLDARHPANAGVGTGVNERSTTTPGGLESSGPFDRGPAATLKRRISFEKFS